MTVIGSALLVLASTVVSTYLATPDDYKYINPTQVWGSATSGKYVKQCAFPRLENNLILSEITERVFSELAPSVATSDYTTNFPLRPNLKVTSALDWRDLYRQSNVIAYNLDAITNNVFQVNSRTKPRGGKYIDDIVEFSPVEGRIDWDNSESPTREYIITNCLLKVNGDRVNGFYVGIQQSDLSTISEYLVSISNGDIYYGKCSSVMDSVFAIDRRITKYLSLGLGADRFLPSEYRGLYSVWNKGATESFNVTTNSYVLGDTYSISQAYYIRREHSQSRSSSTSAISEAWYNETRSEPPSALELHLDSALRFFNDYRHLEGPGKEYSAAVVFKAHIYERYEQQNYSTSPIASTNASQDVYQYYVYTLPLNNLRRQGHEYASRSEYSNTMIATTSFPIDEILSAIKPGLLEVQTLDYDPKRECSLMYPLPESGSTSGRLDVSVTVEDVYIFATRTWR